MYTELGHQCGGDQQVQDRALDTKEMNNVSSPRSHNNFGTKRPAGVEELGIENQGMIRKKARIITTKTKDLNKIGYIP